MVHAHLDNAARQSSWNVSAPTVDLGYAKYQGVRLSGGVDQYLGLRYAQPPLGPLRFRAPQDPLPQLNGTQDASQVSRTKDCRLFPDLYAVEVVERLTAV